MNDRIFSLSSSAFALCTFLLSSFLPLPAAQAATPLSLESYLNQVKEKNEGIKGATSTSTGGFQRSEEAEMLLAPTAFVNFQLSSDSKYTPPVFITYDSINTKVLSFGISQLTTFGLQAKLRYEMMTLDYTNINTSNLGALASAIPLNVANASPVLELTQSLWNNAFGRATRAQQELSEATALASSYGARFQARNQLAEAEKNYWRLALARQSVAVQTEALDRAQKIFDWTSKQARLHLRENSDVLQSQALRQARTLDLHVSKNEEKAAARAFNSSRNIESDQVEESLTKLDATSITEMTLPNKAPLRDDVRAAQESARATAASSTLAIEKDSPTLEVYGLLALNGQGWGGVFSNLSDAMAASLSVRRPTQTVGIRFVAPLNLGGTARARDGWRQEQTGAEMSYQRKLFEQEQSWKDLNVSYSDAKSQLELAVELETIQKSKLSNERDRLLRGRTTTYQVLLFEQDYLLAQLTRIRSQATILNLIAQMKLFGDSL